MRKKWRRWIFVRRKSEQLIAWEDGMDFFLRSPGCGTLAIMGRFPVRRKGHSLKSRRFDKLEPCPTLASEALRFGDYCYTEHIGDSHESRG